MVYVYSESHKWYVPGKGWMGTTEALQSGAKRFEEFREFKNPNDAHAHAKGNDDLTVTVARKRLRGR
jgi:hypothetical protein